MEDDPASAEDGETPVEVGRYARLSQARERGLVMAAMDVPHWIVRDGRSFTLRVEPRCRDLALGELLKYELEAQARLKEVPAGFDLPGKKGSTVSLYVAAWIMSAFWVWQNTRPEKWMESGVADSQRIIEKGEWWRVLTALTLHGDFSHFVANLVTGILFAAFLLRPFGGGLAWLLIVVCGALGNALNAWFYSGGTHLSIGASTAVFGALGLLVGGEFTARLSSSHTRGLWQLILPLGAGLGLLAYLGAGDEAHKQTDAMAHLWGFGAGLALGAAAVALKLRQRFSKNGQRLAAALAPLLLVLAWWRAG